MSEDEGAFVTPIKASMATTASQKPKKIEERFRIYLFGQLICILSPSVTVAGPYEYTGLCKYILQTSDIVFARVRKDIFKRTERSPKIEQSRTDNTLSPITHPKSLCT